MVRDRGETASQRGVHPCRFADDALMAFDNIVDAKRVPSVLGKRLARYGLPLHPDKTRLLDFRPKRSQSARHPETDGTTFDFLGLTHVWGRSRNGKDMLRQVTAQSRFARAVAAVNDWCQKNRHWSLRDQHRHLSSMMRGHFAYYGVGGNSRRLRWFANQVGRLWRKWLSRRDRQGVVRWTRFNELLARHPLPSVKLLHGYAAASDVRTCQGLRRRGAGPALALARRSMLPSASSRASALRTEFTPLNGWPARIPVNASRTASRQFLARLGGSVVR
jgi:hypothetical protein